MPSSGFGWSGKSSAPIFETQKNRVGRVVYLAEDACQALEHWLEVRRRKTELIFSGQGGRPLSYEVARSRF